MRKLNFVFLIIIFITACKPEDPDQLVTIDNKYSISLPAFMIKSKTTLNEDASLEYVNRWKEFYIIVIDELKSEVHKAIVDNELTDKYSEDLEGYTNLLLDNLEQSVVISEKSDMVDTEINGMPAKLITLKARVERMDIFYSYAFIQGKERYYQIMAWTLQEKESEHKDKMNKIMHTFKEL